MKKTPSDYLFTSLQECCEVHFGVSLLIVIHTTFICALNPCLQWDINQCRRSSAGDNSYYCGTSFDEASSMCTHPCPSGSSLECPNGEFCFADTSCNSEFSSEFFVDYSSGSCFKDAAPCPDEVFTCKKVPPPIQTYKSIEECCEQGQSWVDFGFCTSRSIGNYTNGWVVDYTAERCGEYYTYSNPHGTKPFS